MEEKFEGNSTTYKGDLPVKEKLRILYKDPLSGKQHRVTVTYRWNENLPSAIENQLLRDAEFSSWTRKQDVVVPIYTPQINASLSQLYSTVTGFEFKTTNDNVLHWTLFEDDEEIIKRVSINDIPETVPRIPLTDLVNRKPLEGPVYTVRYHGEHYAFKAHESVSQTQLFSAELLARVHLMDVPHIASLEGVVIYESVADNNFYVAGMLLKYYAKFDLKFLLQYSDQEVEWTRKMKWAAQIAHGVIEIQKKGVMHGDLRCANIVIDDSDDAYIIDIVNGRGGMEGWTSILDAITDPRRDVYAFGVTLWELVRDGQDPIHPLEVLDKADIDRLVRDCVVDDASKRTNMDTVFNILSRKSNCGCRR